MGTKAVVFLLALFAGASAFASEDVALRKGRKAADALTLDLHRRVLTALAESGPMGAISICAYQSQAISNDLAKKEGVEARRTSARLRNDANAPDAYEKEVLLRLDVLARSGSLPVEQIEVLGRAGNRVYRYTKPIVVAERCLVCHGSPEQIPEGVRKYLESRYPEDRARGYRVGDLRGIVSVSIPEEATQ